MPYMDAMGNELHVVFLYIYMFLLNFNSSWGRFLHIFSKASVNRLDFLFALRDY